MKKTICLLMVVLLCGVFAWAQNGVNIAEGPAMLTSIGQSPDMQLVSILLTRAGITYDAETLVTANQLTSRHNTLIVVIGGSSKGLGAAGISPEDELRRSDALIARARELGMQVIALHVGGEDRRGDLTDRFIRQAVPLADYVIVVAEGNRDGLFTSLTNQARIPIDSVDRLQAIGTPLAAAFR
ncbi:MAG: DUF6305 family protein [Treponema sp.]|nr:DUF6305 family protein [Treponema sp.]